MAVRNDFSPGEVLASADLNDTFASKVDYALPTNAQTGTAYTFVAADAEKLTTASNGSAVTLTIPPASSVAWPDETILRVVNYGAGAVTIDGGSGVTVTNTSSTIAQYGAAVAIRTGSDAWTVVPFGGGDIPAATVSSPAATGQYTDGGGQTWDYYTFTASGTLTVDTAGLADILVVSGGGGGGGGPANADGGGGGAGGHNEVINAYLPVGTLTVFIGAGGAGSSSGIRQSGQSGTTSLLLPYGSFGGGGGGGNGAAGSQGGSGGGAGYNATGGAGITSLGNAGGSGDASGGGGGGGGAGSVGSLGTGTIGGAGGSGMANSFTGTSVTRAGGGGGGGPGGGGAAGSGGGGAGATSGAGGNGTANTGGGGGGSNGNAGGAGGSGVVIVRVKV